MKTYICLLLVTILGYSAITEATKCSVCGYVSGLADDEIPDQLKPFLDESCKVGNTPNSKFLQACQPYTYPGLENTEIACGVGSFKGSLPEVGITEELELTVRGCVPMVAGLTEGCEDLAKADLLNIPDLSVEIRDALEMLPDDFKAQICIAKGTEDEISAGTFVKFNHVLWVLPLLCFVSKLF